MNRVKFVGWNCGEMRLGRVYRFAVGVLVLFFGVQMPLHAQEVEGDRQSGIIELQERETRMTERLYAKHVNNVYTVQIRDRVTDSELGHGTGFFLQDSPFMVTNYHVISEHLNDPDQYQLRLQLSKDVYAPIRVVAFDIVHDLALLEVKLDSLPVLEKASIGDGMRLDSQAAIKGQPLYALGNPHGLGLIIVPGVFNGEAERSLVDLIHFTGAINPGMSGGPAIDRRGRVVGVNVATSGNSIGFLVPVKYVNALVQRAQRNDILHMQSSLRAENTTKNADDQRANEHQNQFTEYKNAIALEGQRQLQLYQEQLLTKLLSEPLPTKKLHGRPVVKELGRAFACHGSSDTFNLEEEQYFTTYTRNCHTQGRIYLNSDFSTGQIHYAFQVYTDPIRPLALSTLLGNHLDGFADNYADQEHVTEYTCIDSYTAHESPKFKETVDQFRTVYCTRQYVHYLGLGDVLFLALEVPKPGRNNDDIEVFVAEYALAGVSSTMADAFLERFLEALQWR